jgi:hypothetical protein
MIGIRPADALQTDEKTPFRRKYRSKRPAGRIREVADSSRETPVTPYLMLIESRYPSTGLGARADEEDSTPEARQDRLALG